MGIKFEGLREVLTLTEIDDTLISVLKLAAIWSNRPHVGRQPLDVRVSSFNDHEHQRADPETGKRESYHYSNRAMDLIVVNQDGSPNWRGIASLTKWLKTHCFTDPSIDIINEKSHVHVEIDRRERDRK